MWRTVSESDDGGAAHGGGGCRGGGNAAPAATVKYLLRPTLTWVQAFFQSSIVIESHDPSFEKVRDYVLELSMNEKVQQQLNTSELDAVFKESDLVRDSIMRGGRAGGGSELYTIVRDMRGAMFL